MIMLKHFSLFTKNVDILAFESWPINLSFDHYRFIIRYENSKFFISSSRPFFINNHKCNISEIIPGDLIKIDNEFIFFDGMKRFKGSNAFLGKIRIPGDEDKLLIFKLSRKNASVDYKDITEIMIHLPEAGKIFVDVSATQFMDSQAIQSMMTLLQKARDAKRLLFFYKPSEKFITYLKLANIEKQVPVLSSTNRHIDQFIEERVKSLQNHAEAIHFSISDHHRSFTILPETVFSVGRLNTSCGLLLLDNQISRVHALFVNTDACLYLVDCQSTNFSYINGLKVAPYSLNPLKNNDSVVFGQNSHFIIERISH